MKSFYFNCRHYKITFDGHQTTCPVHYREVKYGATKKFIHVLILKEEKESLTNLFHNVISVPDACSIKKGYGDAIDADTCFNHITSGSSNFRNYCPLTLYATRRPCSIS